MIEARTAGPLTPALDALPNLVPFGDTTDPLEDVLGTWWRALGGLWVPSPKVSGALRSLAFGTRAVIRLPHGGLLAAGTCAPVVPASGTQLVWSRS